MESTDGCCKPYRCGVALCFLSLLTSNFNLTIDRMIGVPEHDMDIIHAINICDMQYLRSKMCMIGTPEAKDRKNRIEPHSMVKIYNLSFEEECKNLFENYIRINGVKVKNKYEKKESQE